MWRVASGLTIGIVLGAMGAYYYLVRGPEPGVNDAAGYGSNSRTPPALAEPGTMDQASVGGTFSERSSIYQLAAESDFASLPSLIEEAAAQPESPERGFLLTTLLSRYAESAPREAIAFADDLALDRSILAALYGSWVRSDPAAALDAWSLIDEAKKAQAIGMALFESLGANEQTLSIVLTSLPPNLDASRFQTELFGLWAETEPQAALRKTLSLQRRSTQTSALEKVAKVWSERDPRAALGALSRIDDPELQKAFEAKVLLSWSTFEPESAFEHIVGLEDTSRRRSGLANRALRGIAQSDPLRALELAERLPGAGSRWGRHVAMRAWAVDDVSGALTYLENLPATRRRQELQSVVARTYGARDPEGAFAWARNLKPRSPSVLHAVVDGIARNDPGRAVDAVLSLDSEETQRNAMTMIAAQVSYSGDPEALANRLTTLSDGKVKDQAVQTLTSNWAQADPESALMWLLGNADHAGAHSFRQVAQQLGHADPEMAVRYTSKVPSAYRDAWIQHVAPGYAQIDSTAAFNWISQYQGEPAYEAGLAAMIRHSSQEDPRGAARMLETIVDSPHSAAAASTIAAQWVRSEPRAASTWAQELNQDEARSSALAGVARQWGDSDPQAAQRWVLELTVDSDRDVALASLLPAIASKETPGASLLTAFSSDTARHQAIPQVVYQVARRDPQAARALIDEYVSDEQTRRQAEQMLLAGQSNR